MTRENTTTACENCGRQTLTVSTRDDHPNTRLCVACAGPREPTTDRELISPVPLTDRDADRLDALAADISDHLDAIDADARVCGWDYGTAELTIRLRSLDSESEDARRQQIDYGYYHSCITRAALDAINAHPERSVDYDLTNIPTFEIEEVGR